MTRRLPSCQVCWATAFEVVLHAPPDELRSRLPATLGTLDAHPDGTLLRGRAERIDGLARMLAGFGARFTVHTPDELRTAVRELAERLTNDANRP